MSLIYLSHIASGLTHFDPEVVLMLHVLIFQIKQSNGGHILVLFIWPCLNCGYNPGDFEGWVRLHD